MKQITKKLARNESGASAFEYGLIMALISLVAIAALDSIGVSLDAIYNTVSDSVDEPVDNLNN